MAHGARPATALTGLLAGLLLAVLVAVPVAADGPPAISAVAVGTATIDMSAHVPTVVVRLSCAVDVPSPFIRIRATLTEHDATPAAGASATALAKHVAVSSFQTAATGCTAGGTVDVPIPFGPQQGTFMPGRAEIVGFAAASFPYEGFLAFGPTTVIVRPD